MLKDKNNTTSLITEHVILIFVTLLRDCIAQNRLAYLMIKVT